MEAEWTFTYWLLVITFYCCAWCLFAHCIVTPLGTCFKRENNFDEKYLTKDKAFHLLGAHRGGRLERSENSLEAFKHAHSKGVNFLELDLSMTKDEKVIIFHDPDLGRVCGPDYIDRRPDEFNYEDLPLMQREIGDSESFDTIYELKDEESGKIPLLEDLFAWAEPLDKVCFSIDNKTGNNT